MVNPASSFENLKMSYFQYLCKGGKIDYQTVTVNQTKRNTD